MGMQIFLGKPSASITQWIKDHHGPVIKEATIVKYTASSGLPNWEGDIVGKLTDSSIPNRLDIVEVEIGSQVTSIGDYAFSGCSGLTSVTMPNSVTSIGSSAFSDCNEVLYDTTTIPGVKLVDGWVVDNNSPSGDLNLTGVRGIADSAFYFCKSLTSMMIPNSVTSIGSSAFSDCYSLTSVTFSGKNKATVQGMGNYSWALPFSCVLHCTDGNITI